MTLATFTTDIGFDVQVVGHRLLLQGQNGPQSARATIGKSSGKYFFEVTPRIINSDGESGELATVGIMNSTGALHSEIGQIDDDGWGYRNTGRKIHLAQPAYGATWLEDDTIGVLLEFNGAGVGTLTFYKNGVSQGVAYNNIPAGTYYPAISLWGNNSETEFNFGDSPFAFAQPPASALWDDTSPIAGAATISFACSGTLTGTVEQIAVPEPAQGHGAGPRHHRLVTTGRDIDELLREWAAQMERERKERERQDLPVVAAETEQAAARARARADDETLLLLAA